MRLWPPGAIASAPLHAQRLDAAERGDVIDRSLDIQTDDPRLL